MTNNLMIDLKQRTDSDGRVFYVGKLKGPFSIDCKDGVTFLIFTSDIGEEQLQVAPFQERDKDKRDKDKDKDSDC